MSAQCQPSHPGLNISLRSSYLGWLGEAGGKEEEEGEKAGQDITTHCLLQHQSRDKNFKFLTQSFVLFWYLESPYRRQSVFPDPWKNWATLWATSTSLGSLTAQHSQSDCSTLSSLSYIFTFWQLGVKWFLLPCCSEIDPWCGGATSDVLSRAGPTYDSGGQACLSHPVSPPVVTAWLVRAVSWPVSQQTVLLRGGEGGGDGGPQPATPLDTSQYLAIPASLFGIHQIAVFSLIFLSLSLPARQETQRLRHSQPC